MVGTPYPDPDIDRAAVASKQKNSLMHLNIQNTEIQKRLATKFHKGNR